VTFTGTKNFSPAEVACKCGCGMLPEANFMQKAQMARDIVSFSLPVSSGARCPAYNQVVSTTGPAGPHTTGRAIDFAVRGADALKLILALSRCGFTGIGVAQKGDKRFIHADDLPATPSRPRPHIWSY